MIGENVDLDLLFFSLKKMQESLEGEKEWQALQIKQWRRESVKNFLEDKTKEEEEFKCKPPHESSRWEVFPQDRYYRRTDDTTARPLAMVEPAGNFHRM